MTASRWLPVLPKGWRVARLQHLAMTTTSNVDKHAVDGQDPVRLCNYVDVYKNDSIRGDIDFMTATATTEQVERFRLRRGDVVITKDSETADDIGVPAFVDYEAPDLVCAYHLSIVRPLKETTDPRYLYWVLASEATTNQWRVLATGVTRVGLKIGDIARLQVPLPPLPQQRAIADYLDRETAQIDTLIEEQRRLIALVRERRDTLVSATLKSFPPVRLRRLVDLERPMSYGILQCGPPVTDGVPYVGPSDLPGEGCPPVVSDLRRTSAEIASEYQRSVLKEGDVLVSIGPAYGRVGVVPAELSGGNITQDVVRVAPTSAVVPDYLIWALRSQDARAYWELEIQGATFRRLNLGTLARTPIPLPEPSTQVQVAHELGSATARMDRLLNAATRLIELSLERRAALITAAVSGQIDTGVNA